MIILKLIETDKDLNNQTFNQGKLSLLEIFKNFTEGIFNYLESAIKDGSNNGTRVWGKGIDQTLFLLILFLKKLKLRKVS